MRSAFFLQALCRLGPAIRFVADWGTGSVNRSAPDRLLTTHRCFLGSVATGPFASPVAPRGADFVTNPFHVIQRQILMTGQLNNCPPQLIHLRESADGRPCPRLGPEIDTFHSAL